METWCEDLTKAPARSAAESAKAESINPEQSETWLKWKMWLIPQEPWDMCWNPGH